MRAVPEPVTLAAAAPRQHNEIELVPSQPDTTLRTRAMRHMRPSDEDEEEEEETGSLPDAERRPISQLRALVVILFLYIVMWMCGALAVAKPFAHIIPYQELIFSYAYGLFATLFGGFMLLFFCLTRRDGRNAWKKAGGCPAEELTVEADIQVTEIPESPVLPPPPETLVNGGGLVKTGSNTNISIYSQKSSNIAKAFNMKNKESNINLILPNSSEISFDSATHDSNNYPNFFNPRQNGAAKKFWEKNRQHSNGGKLLNKTLNRDLDTSLTDNNSLNELNHRLSRGSLSSSARQQQQQSNNHNNNNKNNNNTHLSIQI